MKTTQVGENIQFKLAIEWKQKEKEDQQAAKPAAGKSVQCRICRGNHYTAFCPYKDSGLVPIDELNASINNAAGTDTPDTQDESGSVPMGGTGSRYIAPHLRGDKNRGASSMARDRDDSATLRVTNVSEDATDDDLRALFSRFGAIARIYLAKDRETGRAKGYAFISYHNRSDAAMALEKMDKYGFDNLIIRCEWAANRPQ